MCVEINYITESFSLSLSTVTILSKHLKHGKPLNYIDIHVLNY